MSSRRTRTLATAMLASLALTLAACTTATSSGQPGSFADPNSSAPATAQATPTAKDRQGTDNTPITPNSDFTLPPASKTLDVDPQGMLRKKIGELAGVVTTDEKRQRLIDFSVASITVDYKCQTGTDIKASNGQFIAVELWVQTMPELASSKDPYFGVSPKEFDLRNATGSLVTQTLDTRAAHACLDNGLGLPARIAPGQKIRGLVVLDSPLDVESLILSQRATKGPGWIWTLPPAQTAR